MQFRLNAIVAPRTTLAATLLLPAAAKASAQVNPLADFDSSCVNELNGYGVEFLSDKSGAVIQAAIYQPNGNFIAKKRL